MRVLDDEAVLLSYDESQESITLIGMDDDTSVFTKERTTVLEKYAESGGEDNPFTILLAHEPQYMPEYAKFDIDLVMSGHAHGGQFRIPFIGGFVAPGQGFLPKYTKGLYEENGTKMIVSAGLGNSVIPLRLLNRPEVGKITLKLREN